MTLKPLVAAAAIVAAAATMTSYASAQSGVQLGQLNCTVDAGVGFIFGSSKDMECVFTPANSELPRETYTGFIDKFGIDVGFTGKSVIAWTVVAAEADKYAPKALSGTYTGATASAAVGAGLGANVLIGGSESSFALQPLSVSAGTGLNAAAGLAQVTLQ